MGVYNATVIDLAEDQQDRQEISIGNVKSVSNSNIFSTMDSPVTNGQDDDLDGDHQLTITSLSGQPLLVPRHTQPVQKPLIKAKQKAKEKRAKEKKKRAELERIDGLRNRFVPPDGGYGWTVAFGAFLVQFWVAGLIKSYGVIYMEVLQLFPDARASLASWIPAILASLCMLLSPVSSALSQKFSCRSVVFIGGLFCYMGISLSFFAQSLTQLLFTFGVLTGIGAGLSTTPGIIMTSRYFSKRRALANGICVSGTAAGGICIPPLMEILVPQYGFRGTMLILGGCMLHVCLSSALYRPIEVHQHIIECEERNRKKQEQIQKINVEEQATLEEQQPNLKPDSNKLQVAELFTIPEDGISVGDGASLNYSISMRASFKAPDLIHSMEDLSTDSTCFYKDNISVGTASSLRPSNPNLHKKEDSHCCNIGRYIDFSLIANPMFLLLVSTVMMTSVGCPHMLFYVPSYAISVGLSKYDASWLLSISAIFDLVGRLGFGWIADLKLFSYSKGYCASILLAGLSVACLPFATTFNSLVVIVSFYGLGFGCWFLMIPVLLSDYFGTDKIGSSYGLCRLFQGNVMLMTPPLIGFIKDSTGYYIPGFYFMGASMLCAAMLINLEPCAKRWADDRKSRERTTI